MGYNLGSLRLVLLPGLGADHRQWQPQEAAFPGLCVPTWIPPVGGETLPSYATRLAESIPRDQPLVLGGSSFGGMVALEMARHLHPKALVLIGSCRSPAALHRAVLWLRPILCRVPVWAVKLARPFAPCGSAFLRGLTPEFRRLCSTMFQEADPAFTAWAIGAILCWQPNPLADTPVFHLHGQCDRMIRSSRVVADCLVPGGGHVINLSHVEVVNDFIRKVLESAELSPERAQ